MVDRCLDSGLPEGYRVGVPGDEIGDITNARQYVYHVWFVIKNRVSSKVSDPSE